MSSAQQAPALNVQMKRNYEFSRRMLDGLLEGFTAEDALARVGDFKPLVWYLGHIAVAENAWLQLHRGAASLLPQGHTERYSRGSDGEADFADASLDELTALLATLRQRIKSAIAEIEPADLERETPVETFPPLKQCGNAFALICGHTAYHAGQIQLLRRAMGKGTTFG